MIHSAALQAGTHVHHAQFVDDKRGEILHTSGNLLGAQRPFRLIRQIRRVAFYRVGAGACRGDNRIVVVFQGGDQVFHPGDRLFDVTAVDGWLTATPLLLGEINATTQFFQQQYGVSCHP
ncbi:hypothetical protein SDC9_199265 [bioreactor metagenome]|uniref:Uncharacterized protein n=1 Tax=bioreactor metagenome TaxID=1076179 RepID=A0A645IK11_9ZZZZ